VNCTVTAAVPLSVPVVARTVALPGPDAGAVYTPAELTPPTPPLSIVHVNVGCDAIAALNWSRAVAVSDCVSPFATVVVAGETDTDVSVWFTVKFTVLVNTCPRAFCIVTWKTYAPALPNVTVLLAAAWFPFGENVGVGAPAGTVGADHVYVMPLSPSVSLATAYSNAVVPVTGLGVAVAPTSNSYNSTFENTAVFVVVLSWLVTASPASTPPDIVID
jgi:hypothetical protein